MKKLLSLALFFSFYQFSFAQHIDAADIKSLQQKEDSLKWAAQQILIGRRAEDRVEDKQLLLLFIRFFANDLDVVSSR